jgi:hypothetical protein
MTAEVSSANPAQSSGPAARRSPGLSDAVV